LATAYQDLRKDLIPYASSTTQIIQQIGGAFGTAVLAVILQNQFAQQSTMNIAVKSIAFNYTFWWSLAFTMIAFIPVILLPRNGHKSSNLLAEEQNK
jgi:hypothetical protein